MIEIVIDCACHVCGKGLDSEDIGETHTTAEIEPGEEVPVCNFCFPGLIELWRDTLSYEARGGILSIGQWRDLGRGIAPKLPPAPRIDRSLDIDPEW